MAVHSRETLAPPAAPPRVRARLHAHRLALPRRRGRRAARDRRTRRCRTTRASTRSTSRISRRCSRASTRTASPTRCYEPDSGFADPVATTERVRRRRAGGLGGDARDGARVESIEVDGGRVTRRPRRRRAPSSATPSCSPPGRGRSRSAADGGRRAAARDHARAGRRLRDRAPSRRSPARSRRRSTASTCGRRPSTARATCSSGAASRRTTSTSTPTSYDDRGRRRVRGATCASASRGGCRGSPACAGRRARRPVRRHPRLASDPRPGRRRSRASSSRRGGSGHCFKLAPAIGELVAGVDLGAQGRSTPTSRASRVERFAEGREFRSTYGGNRA